MDTAVFCSALVHRRRFRDGMLNRWGYWVGVLHRSLLHVLFSFRFLRFPMGDKSLASFLFLLPVRLFGFPVTAVRSSSLVHGSAAGQKGSQVIIK